MDDSIFSDQGEFDTLAERIQNTMAKDVRKESHKYTPYRAPVRDCQSLHPLVDFKYNEKVEVNTPSIKSIIMKVKAFNSDYDSTMERLDIIKKKAQNGILFIKASEKQRRQEILENNKAEQKEKRLFEEKKRRLQGDIEKEELRKMNLERAIYLLESGLESLIEKTQLTTKRLKFPSPQTPSYHLTPSPNPYLSPSPQTGSYHLLTTSDVRFDSRRPLSSGRACPEKCVLSSQSCVLFSYSDSVKYWPYLSFTSELSPLLTPLLTSLASKRSNNEHFRVIREALFEVEETCISRALEAAWKLHSAVRKTLGKKYLHFEALKMRQVCRLLEQGQVAAIAEAEKVREEVVGEGGRGRLGRIVNDLMIAVISCYI